MGLPSHPTKTLLIENDSVVQALIKSFLGNIGCEELIILENSANLESILSQANADLIILDWRNKRPTGAEILTGLRDNFDSMATPVLLISGVITHNDLAVAKDPKVKFLIKPFTEDLFKRSLIKFFNLKIKKAAGNGITVVKGSGSVAESNSLQKGQRIKSSGILMEGTQRITAQMSQGKMLNTNADWTMALGQTPTIGWESESWNTLSNNLSSEPAVTTQEPSTSWESDISWEEDEGNKSSDEDAPQRQSTPENNAQSTPNGWETNSSWQDMLKTSDPLPPNVSSEPWGGIEQLQNRAWEPDSNWQEQAPNPDTVIQPYMSNERWNSIATPDSASPPSWNDSEQWESLKTSDGENNIIIEEEMSEESAEVHEEFDSSLAWDDPPPEIADNQSSEPIPVGARSDPEQTSPYAPPSGWESFHTNEGEMSALSHGKHPSADAKKNLHPNAQPAAANAFSAESRGQAWEAASQKWESIHHETLAMANAKYPVSAAANDMQKPFEQDREWELSPVEGASALAPQPSYDIAETDASIPGGLNESTAQSRESETAPLRANASQPLQSNEANGWDNFASRDWQAQVSAPTNQPLQTANTFQPPSDANYAANRGTPNPFPKEEVGYGVVWESLDASARKNPIDSANAQIPGVVKSVQLASQEPMAERGEFGETNAPTQLKKPSEWETTNSKEWQTSLASTSKRKEENGGDGASSEAPTTWDSNFDDARLTGNKGRVFDAENSPLVSDPEVKVDIRAESDSTPTINIDPTFPITTEEDVTFLLTEPILDIAENQAANPTAEASTLASEVVMAPTPALSELARSAKQILVSDTNLGTLDILRSYFQLFDLGEVTYAKSGAEFWHALTTKIFDFVILDWELKKPSALAIYNQIKWDSRYKFTPIILTSTQLGKDDFKILTENQPTIALAKPYEISHLHAALNEVAIKAADFKQLDAKISPLLDAKQLNAQSILEQTRDIAAGMASPVAALNHIGERLLKTKYLKLACAIFQIARKLDKENPITTAGIAKSLLLQNRHKEAARILNQCESVSIQSIERLLSLTEEGLTLANSTKARAHLQKIMNLKRPLRSRIFSSKAKNVAASDSAPLHAIIPGLLNLSGISLVKQKEFQKAIEQYSACYCFVEKGAQMAAIHFNIGMACLRQNDLQKAKVWFKKTLKESSTFKNKATKHLKTVARATRLLAKRKSSI